MANSRLLNTGIVGCGLIGEKRAKALGDQAKLIACADVNEVRAAQLSATFKATPYTDWRKVIKDPQIDMVIVATQHDSLSEIAYEAICNGKHVFIEKPAARHSTELEPLIKAAKSRNVKVRVGFNHRYHRALQKAKLLIDSGELGELMFIRARYGHGGRVGYDTEWRANAAISGGGELIDQGPHLIDLSRWFLGEFTEVSGYAHTYYWKMPVDDNAFMMLRTEKSQTAFLHVSCTEWKNTFSMEIYGKSGKLDISGLGGSYGVERLTYYKMLPQMGPPETTSWEYPMADNSWALELAEFYKDIQSDRQPDPGLVDALACLKIIDQIYQNSPSVDLS